jgi:two-component system OmpR family response regulator
MRILLVEDDKDLQRLLKKALGDAGYVVDSAMDGEEGHFLGDTEPYDAVILDLGLPKMDGVTVLEKWRKSGKTMPVLILTARDWRSTRPFLASASNQITRPSGVIHFRW